VPREPRQGVTVSGNAGKKIAGRKASSANANKLFIPEKGGAVHQPAPTAAQGAGGRGPEVQPTKRIGCEEYYPTGLRDKQPSASTAKGFGRFGWTAARSNRPPGVRLQTAEAVSLGLTVSNFRLDQSGAYIFKFF